MELKEVIENVTFFGKINPTFQIQMKQKKLEFHILADNYLHYTVYTIPLESTTESGYYCLNSSEWLSRLNLMKEIEKVIFNVEMKFENRLFLSVHDYPSYRQSVHIELQDGNHEKILDVHRITTSEHYSCVGFESSQQFLQWISPCLTLSAHHTELMIKPPSDFSMTIIDAANDTCCNITYNKATTSGQHNQPFCIDMKLLVPFLGELLPKPCKLMWTLGRPLELDLDMGQGNIVVFVAPCEIAQPSYDPEYHPPNSPPPTTKRRKKINPPPVLNI